MFRLHIHTTKGDRARIPVVQPNSVTSGRCSRAYKHHQTHTTHTCVGGNRLLTAAAAASRHAATSTFNCAQVRGVQNVKVFCVMVLASGAPLSSVIISARLPFFSAIHLNVNAPSTRWVMMMCVQCQSTRTQIMYVQVKCKINEQSMRAPHTRHALSRGPKAQRTGSRGRKSALVIVICVRTHFRAMREHHFVANRGCSTSA